MGRRRYQRYVERRRTQPETLSLCGALNNNSIRKVAHKIQHVKATSEDIDRIMVNYPNLVPQEIISANMATEEIYQNYKPGFCLRKIDCESEKTDLKGFTLVLNIDADRAIEILLSLAFYSITIGDLTMGPCALHLPDYTIPTFLAPDADHEHYLRILLADPAGRFVGDPQCDPMFAAQALPLKHLQY